MRIIHEIGEIKWNDYIYSHPAANVFHTPEMFAVFSETNGYEPDLWAVEDGHEQILAIMLPVRVELSSLISGLTSRSIVYGGILFQEGKQGKEALELLLHSYNGEVERAPIFTELRNLHDLSSVQPTLQKNGYEYEEHLNYLIDISQSADVVFNGIGRRTRKNIRRALNRGRVIVEQVTNKDKLSACMRLIKKTYENARVPLAHQSLFENAFKILSPKDMIRVTMASVDGQLAAASIELLYKDVIYGWYGGLDRNYSSYVPNELLMWDILKWGAESNYKVYDFGGAGKPDEEYGVRDFKAKFGGELVSYGRNTLVHRPGMLKISKFGYQVYQSLMG